MLFCPNCDNILDISKNPPKHKPIVKQELDTPITVSNSEDESESDVNDEEDEKIEIDILDEIINKLADGKKVDNGDLSDYKLEQFVKHKTYQKKLDKKTKAIVLEKLTEFYDKIDDATSAYYFCKNCMYSKAIDAGTLISKKINPGIATESANTDKFKNRIHSKILPYTKNYICINDKCPSHKNVKLREAVFFRTGGSLQVWYTCRACETYWKGK